MELEELIQYTKPLWITIKDIKNLRKNQKLTLISFNRNIYYTTKIRKDI